MIDVFERDRLGGFKDSKPGPVNLKSMPDYEDSKPPCQCLASAEVHMVQGSHAGPWVPALYSDK